MDWQQPALKTLIQLALTEDCARSDVTSNLTLLDNSTAVAEVIARENLLVCGLPIVEQVFAELGWPAQVKYFSAEGQKVQSGAVLLSLHADIKHLLAAERVVLNFLQRMSGVATYTRTFVDQADGLALYDTRKTTPGWRVLEKYAVRVAGANNQRAHLADAILLKNNHIDALLGSAAWSAQSLTDLLLRLVSANTQGLSIQVEVRNTKELQAVLAAPIERIMLDNMDDQQIAECMRMVKASKPDLFVEVSGNVDINRLQTLKRLGVSGASLGAFTRKAGSVDIAMRVLT